MGRTKEPWELKRYQPAKPRKTPYPEYLYEKTWVRMVCDINGKQVMREDGEIDCRNVLLRRRVCEDGFMGDWQFRERVPLFIFNDVFDYVVVEPPARWNPERFKWQAGSHSIFGNRLGIGCVAKVYKQHGKWKSKTCYDRVEEHWIGDDVREWLETKPETDAPENRYRHKGALYESLWSGITRDERHEWAREFFPYGQDVKTTYRKLCSIHHPDHGGDAVYFRRVEEAYRILSKEN